MARNPSIRGVSNYPGAMETPFIEFSLVLATILKFKNSLYSDPVFIFARKILPCLILKLANAVQFSMFPCTRNFSAVNKNHFLNFLFSKIYLDKLVGEPEIIQSEIKLFGLFFRVVPSPCTSRLSLAGFCDIINELGLCVGGTFEDFATAY